MKILMSILMGTVMLLTLSACQNEQTPTSNTAAPHGAAFDKSSVALPEPVSPAPSSDIAPSPDDNSKILVAYFSRTGNTETIADMITQATNGVSFKIETTKPYPEDYTETTVVAKREQADKARPSLSTHFENLADCDTVFIGFPIWWGTPPMAVLTFLEEYDFAGKTIVPFCTHAGSGMGNSANVIALSAPDATVLEGLSLGENDVADAGETVTAWLDKLEY